MIQRIFFSLISLALSIQCVSQVDDGIYLIEQVFEDSIDDIGHQKDVIPYNHRFLGDNTENQPRFVKINTGEFVPLRLKESPTGIEEKGGKTRLMLELNNKASKHLRKFTRRNKGKVIGIVISGEVVTIHKVRTKIKQGKLQITRCDDNACKFLEMELKDNVVQ